MKKDKSSAGPPPQLEPVPQDQAPPAVTGSEGGLSRDEYSRTTGGSPATTAVIPAIKDEPAPAAPASEADVVEPATATEPETVTEPHAATEPDTATEPEPAVLAATVQLTAAVQPTVQPTVVQPTVEPVGSTTPAHESPLVNGRTAGLRLVHVDPYSVTRLAFVVSVALMIVSVVAVAIFWIVLAVTGVWGQINDSVGSLLSDDSGSFDIKDYLGFWRMVGGTLVVSGINVILMTALATVGAHLFNLAAALLGGIETTFTDE